jgi:hypothetical protein
MDESIDLVGFDDAVYLARAVDIHLEIGIVFEHVVMNSAVDLLATVDQLILDTGMGGYKALIS